MNKIKFGHKYEKHNILFERPQYLYKFVNGFGASVIWNPFLWENKSQGYWELLVVAWDNERSFKKTKRKELEND